jgi:DNA repair exonuclease SbcCD ATPase subunit
VCKQVVDQEVIKKYGSNIQVNLDKLNVKLNDFILIKSKNEINKNLISSIQADIAKLEDTYEEQESEESKKSLYLSNLGTFKERINEYSLKINKYGTLLTKYTEKINLLRTVKTALSNVGIKTQIINTLIPILNIKINKYSQELIGPHVSITIKTTKETNTKTIQNKFFVDIKGYASYNSCSSGEKRKVDICVLLGFADMLTHINRQNNFIIFDELVDNLDNVGLERCSNLIKNLNYDNIFIVTHNEEMKNYFNNVLFIEKTPDGISRLRVQ